MLGGDFGRLDGIREDCHDGSFDGLNDIREKVEKKRREKFGCCPVNTLEPVVVLNQKAHQRHKNFDLLWLGEKKQCKCLRKL
jgi:hypothetical protein